MSMDDRHNRPPELPELDEALVDYVYGELSAAEEEAFQQRLEAEPELKTEAERLSLLKSCIEELDSPQPPPEAVANVLAEAARRARTVRVQPAPQRFTLGDLWLWLLRPQVGLGLTAMLVVAIGTYVWNEAKRPLQPGSPTEVQEALRPTKLPRQPAKKDEAAPQAVVAKKNQQEEKLSRQEDKEESFTRGATKTDTVTPPDTTASKPVDSTTARINEKPATLPALEEAASEAKAAALPPEGKMEKPQGSAEQRATDTGIQSTGARDRNQRMPQPDSDRAGAQERRLNDVDEARLDRDNRTSSLSARSSDTTGAVAGGLNTDGSASGEKSDKANAVAVRDILVKNKKVVTKSTADIDKKDRTERMKGKDTVAKQKKQATTRILEEEQQKSEKSGTMKVAENPDLKQAIMRNEVVTDEEARYGLDDSRNPEKTLAEPTRKEEAKAEYLQEPSPPSDKYFRSSSKKKAGASPRLTQKDLQVPAAINDSPAAFSTALVPIGNEGGDSGSVATSLTSGVGQTVTPLVNAEEPANQASTGPDEAWGVVNPKVAKLPSRKQTESPVTGEPQMVKVGTDGETVAKQAREEPDLDDSVNLATSEFEEDSGEAAELKVKKVAAEKAKEDAAPSFADQNKSEPTIPEESSTLDCKARWKELLVYETSGQSAAALKLLPMFRTGACKSYRPAQEVALKEAELLVASGKRSKARKALKKLRKIPAMEQKAMDMLEELE